jgi:hypothetical protein
MQHYQVKTTRFSRIFTPVRFVDVVDVVWTCETMGRDPQRKRRGARVWGALWILWTIIYLNLEK